MAVNMARGSIKINKDSFNRVSSLIKTKNRTNAHNALNQLNADFDEVLTNNETFANLVSFGSLFLSGVNMCAVASVNDFMHDILVNNGGYALLALCFLPSVYVYTKSYLCKRKEKQLEKEYRNAFGVDYDKSDRNFKAPIVNHYVKF